MAGPLLHRPRGSQFRAEPERRSGCDRADQHRAGVSRGRRGRLFRPLERLLRPDVRLRRLSRDRQDEHGRFRRHQALHGRRRHRRVLERHLRRPSERARAALSARRDPEREDRGRHLRPLDLRPHRRREPLGPRERVFRRRHGPGQHRLPRHVPRIRGSSGSRRALQHVSREPTSNMWAISSRPSRRATRR